MMSSAELVVTHLTQQELSQKDKDILAVLKDWVAVAEFNSKTNVCTDRNLGEKWTLLSEMDLVKKVACWSQSSLFTE